MKSFWNSACDINPSETLWWGHPTIIDDEQFNLASWALPGSGSHVDLSPYDTTNEESFMFLLFLSHEFDEENV